MSRSLSLYRRKSGIVDILLQRRTGKTGFRFSAAANFDASSTAFAVVPNWGLQSPSVPAIGVVGSPFRNQARFLFSPADYTATAAALIDTNPFYLQIEARNPDGTFDAKEAMHMILPPSMATPNRQVTILGTAPNAASLAGSLEIQLPMQCIDFEIQNAGSVDLFVAFEPTGAEYKITPLGTTFYTFAQQLASISQIFVRGSGGTTTVNAVFTLRNNQIQ